MTKYMIAAVLLSLSAPSFAEPKPAPGIVIEMRERHKAERDALRAKHKAEREATAKILKAKRAEIKAEVERQMSMTCATCETDSECESLCHTEM